MARLPKRFELLALKRCRQIYGDPVHASVVRDVAQLFMDIDQRIMEYLVTYGEETE